MPYRGPKAFPIFVDVLKEDYEWLADDLEEALTLKTEDVTDEVETDELIGKKINLELQVVDQLIIFQMKNPLKKFSKIS